MKWGLTVKKCLVFVCAKAYMEGTVWIEPDKRESMLHMVGKAQYVEGVLQGVYV